MGVELAIGVFAKAPIPGRTKTRLAGTFGSEAAAALHRAFIRDVLAHASALAPVTLFATEEDAFLQESARAIGADLVLQQGDDLGERMTRALGSLRQNARHGVLVGSDAPWWPPAALEAVRQHAISFGPSNDGGFYLVGASTAVDFANIPWSDPHTLSRTLEANPQAALLEPWFDVDDANDLRLLRAWLSCTRGHTEHTRAFLREMGLS